MCLVIAAQAISLDKVVLVDWLFVSLLPFFFGQFGAIWPGSLHYYQTIRFPVAFDSADLASVDLMFVFLVCVVFLTYMGTTEVYTSLFVGGVSSV